MRLRVGESQRAAPGFTEHQPTIDPQVLSQQLEIVDQMPRGVGAEVNASGARMRKTPTGATLVEQHNAVLCRIKQAAMVGLRLSTRSTVQEHRGLAFGVARGLPINALTVADI